MYILYDHLDLQTVFLLDRVPERLDDRKRGCKQAAVFEIGGTITSRYLSVSAA